MAMEEKGRTREKMGGEKDWEDVLAGDERLG